MPSPSQPLLVAAFLLATLSSFAQVSNDDCSSATSLNINADVVCNTTISGTTESATSSGSFSCVPQALKDVWYNFVATENAHAVFVSNVTYTVDGSAADFVLEFYSGTCGNLNARSCMPVLYSQWNFGFGDLTPGETYFIRIVNPYDLAINFDICMAMPPAPPANDACAGAAVLNVDPDADCDAPITGSTVNATSSPTPGCSSCYWADDDIWYSFSATQANYIIHLNNVTNADNAGIAEYAEFQVFTGTCGNLTLVQSYGVYYSGSLLLSTLAPGQTYYIRLYSGNYQTPVSFDLCITSPPPPANDECSGADLVPVNAGLDCFDVFAGSTYFATSSGANCQGGASNDVWLLFVATSQQHRVQLFPSYNQDGYGYEVYSGSCGNLTTLACAYGYNLSTFLYGLTVGETYYMRVFSPSSAAFSFNGCVLTYPPPPPNDECAGAEALPVNGDMNCNTQASGTTLGTTGLAQNCQGDTDTHDLWYSFVATGADHRLEVSLLNTLFGSSYEFGYEVYSGNCGNLVSKVCRQYAFNPYNTLIMNDLVPGETYYIRVFSNYGTAHQFSLCLQTVPPPPPNIRCSDAVVITPSPTPNCDVLTAGSTAGILSDTSSICFYYGTGMNLWYSFTATSGSHIVRITDVQQLYGNTEYWLEFYQGDNCGNISFTGCYTFPGTFYMENLSPGTTYYLRWLSPPFSAQSFNICIGTYPPPVNDACANAVSLTVDNDLNCDDSTAGTTAGGTYEPMNVCFAVSDVWYSFTAEQSVQHIAVNNVIDPEFGGSQYFRAELYSGTCGNLTNFRCWEDYFYDNGTLVAGDLVPGQTYYLRIGNPYNTPIGFNVCVLTPPPPPANDACAGATVLIPETGSSCSNPTAGTTQDATTSFGVPPICCNAGDVWYSFVATQPSHLVTLSNITHSLYGYLETAITELYSSTCGALVFENQNFTYGSSSWLLTNLTAGQEYHLRIYTANPYNTPAINFEICVNAPVPPVNDECAGALTLPVNDDFNCNNTVSASTFAASQSGTSCSGNPATDVWYQFTATHTGYRFDMGILNGAYGQWGYEILGGDCNNLISLRCEDVQYYSSIFTIGGFTPGNTYYLRIFSREDQWHDIYVCARALPPPPANDECPAATPVGVSPDLTCVTQVTGTTLGATESVSSCFGTPNQDVWYSFVATGPSQVMELTATYAYFGESGWFGYQLFSGDCNNLNSITCSELINQNITLLHNLTAGETYYLRVFSLYSIAHDFTLCIKTLPPPPANDLCEQAAEIIANESLTCDNTYSGTTLSATTSAPFYYNPDVWYHFTATSNSHVIELSNIVSIFGYSTVPFVEIYQGNDCNGLVFLGNYYGAGAIQQSYFQPGESYYIRIYSGYSEDAFNFDLCVKTLPPSPPNESCNGAFVLTPNSGLTCDDITAGSTAGAINTDYPSCGYGFDVWYQFTATAPNHYIQALNIAPILNNGGLWIEVLSGTDCANFSTLYCAYYDQQIFLNNLTPGTVYYVRITSEYGTAHNFDLCVKTIPPPPNDLCDNAIALEVDTDQYCDNAISTTSAGAGPSGLSPCGYDGNDVWYTFTATQSAHTILVNNVIDATGGYASSFGVEVYGGPCGNLQNLACRANLYLVDQFTVGELVAGEEYYIRVLAYGLGNNFDICVGTPPPPPLNDACVNATDLPVSTDETCTSPVSGTLEHATATSMPYYGSGLFYNDVWFSFTATQANHLITLNDAAPPSFLFLDVFSGNCGALSLVAQQQMYFNNELLLTNLVAGQTYFVRVYNTSNLPANFDLCVTSIPAPPNDECAGATPVELSPGLFCLNQTEGSTYGATQSLPGCSGSAINDVWFEFTATSASHYIRAISSSDVTFHNYYFGMEVYQGSCGALTTILPCNEYYFEAGYTLQQLVPGETYYIRLYSYANTFQTFNLCVLTFPEPPANDECAQATAIQANNDLSCNLQYSGSTLGATQSNLSCYGYNTHDVWYSFTALGTTQVIKTEITSFPLGSGSLGFEIYGGGDCSGLASIQCSENTSGSPVFVSGLTPGATYFIRIFSYYNNAVDYTLCIQTLPPPPANDNCTEAEVILPNPDMVCNESTAGTTSGLTELQYMGCNTGTGVWYQFTASAPIHLIRLSDIVAQYGYLFLSLELYQGSCEGLQLLNCSNGASELYLPNLSTGTTYWIRVTGFQYAGVDFDLCILTPETPFNDGCEQAFTLSPSGTQLCETAASGTTLGATQSGESSICTYNSDVWYSFEATGTMHTVQISNIVPSGAYYELVYEVLSGQCGTWTSLGCYNAYTSPVLNDLTPGETYHIRVGTYYASAYASFDICVTTPMPDLSVYYIFPYSDGCNTSTNETVQVAFLNGGNAPVPPGEASFTLTVSGENSGTYGPFTNQNTIYPSNIEYVTITGVDLSNAGTSFLTATATLNNDANPSNNSNGIAFNILPLITYYFDADGDGYGDPGYYLVSCYQYQGYVTDNTDCDDANLYIHPGAAEFCNGIDDDCDGLLDADDTNLIDTLPPNITCPANMVVNNASGTCSAVVNYTVTASDDCAYTVIQTSGIASGEDFPVGTTNNSFTVNDPAGNQAVCSFSVEVKKNGDPDLLYAYTVIGFKEVSMKKNTVQSGGVGVVNANKKAILQQSTVVTAPNTFVKAPVLQLQGGSQVTNYYQGQVASGLLPAFQPNNNVGNNNVNIPNNNAPVTLNLNKYGKITVGNNVTVTFSGHATVRIKELEIKENATVLFAQNTTLLIDKTVAVGKNAHINPGGGQDIQFFAEDKITVDKGADVTANMYTQKDLKLEKATANSPTHMTGLFIADKVDALEHVYWNWDGDYCPYIPNAKPIASNDDGSQDRNDADVTRQDGLRLFPNPAAEMVQVVFDMDVETEATLHLFDAAGRLVRTERLDASEGKNQFRLELTGLPEGMYNVRLSAGELRVTEKLVILKH